jgi:hypothetical protein
MQSLAVQNQMAQSIYAFLETAASAAAQSINTLGLSNVVTPIAVVGLSTTLGIDNQQLGVLGQMGNTVDQVEQNQISQALAQLNSSTQPLWSDAQKEIDAVRGAVAQIDSTAISITQGQNQARYEAALGTGQDFFTVNGQVVPMPVNTVLRRQASATEQRYQAALTNAKALAYMARRAIEQRIGVPLAALTQQVGPLDAPASWADDICSLQGVNFANLSTATSSQVVDGGTEPDDASDLQAINQFGCGSIAAA